MKMPTITKAVIPVAGFGTRFLPQTKAMPKEMLPIVDKPIVQIVVEELVEAGIKDIIMVTGWHKRAIEDHFDKHPELETLLQETGKLEILKKVQKITSLANFIYIRQKGPLGNAVPIANSLEIVGKEPILVFWGDDFIVAQPSRARQLIEAYHKFPGVILGSIRTDRQEDTKKYGFAKGKQVGNGIVEVEEIIEKPGPDKVPSNLATVSGFLFTPQIYPYLKQVVKKVQGREPNYIDAISAMIKDKAGKVYAVEFKKARYYDTGSKLGYLQAVIDFGLKHPETKDGLRQFIKDLK